MATHPLDMGEYPCIGISVLVLQGGRAPPAKLVFLQPCLHKSLQTTHASRSLQHDKLHTQYLNLFNIRQHDRHPESLNHECKSSNALVDCNHKRPLSEAKHSSTPCTSCERPSLDCGPSWPEGKLKRCLCRFLGGVPVFFPLKPQEPKRVPPQKKNRRAAHFRRPRTPRARRLGLRGSGRHPQSRGRRRPTSGPPWRRVPLRLLRVDLRTKVSSSPEKIPNFELSPYKLQFRVPI